MLIKFNRVKTVKKIIGIFFVVIIISLFLIGFDKNAPDEIIVVSREDGSGTRGAFIELFSIEEKDKNGNRKDYTTKEAIITSKTDVMLANIANDKNAIGYISLGSLNSSVKALNIDDIKPTENNVKNGTYKIKRYFNIATKGESTGLTKDFIDFILSKEGQEIIAKDYISVDENFNTYSGDKPSGRIVIAGSSSVSPIMEKLKEAYLKINTNAIIEIQMTDSTGGITSAIDGTCDIGMSSRELKDSEKEQLKEIQIAIDGIVVIVNNENTFSNLTKEQVKLIFTGIITRWDEM